MANRSWIDPIVNATVFDETAVAANIEELIQGVLAPGRLLPFMHEVTHHWCFHSGVGASISLLRLKALKYMSLVEGTQSSTGTDWYLRSGAAIRLLRPIAEGMALFAEFDIRADSPEAPSIPLSWTALLSIDEVSESPIEDAMERIRLHPSALDRKEDLLTSPLGDFQSGYLLGYLCIKRAWLSALRLSKPISTDDWLTHVFCRIWSDPLLIHILLDETLSTETAVQRFSQRLAELIRSLDEPLQSGMPLSVLPQKAPGRVTLAESEDIPAPIHDEAEDRLNELYDYLRVYADGPSIIPTFDLIATIMRRRQFFSLGYIEGTLSRRDDKLLLDKGNGRELELEGLSLGRLHDGLDGVIEFLIDFSSKSLFFAVFQGRETITARTIASLTDSLLPQTIISTPAAIRAREGLEAKTERNTGPLEDLLDGAAWCGTAAQTVREALDEKAMRFVPQDQVAGLHALLAKQGYWVALQKDRSALRCLAALSMAESTGLAPAISRLVAEGSDVASGLAAIERLDAEYPGSIFAPAPEGRPSAV